MSKLPADAAVFAGQREAAESAADSAVWKAALMLSC